MSKRVKGIFSFRKGRSRKGSIGKADGFEGKYKLTNTVLGKGAYGEVKMGMKLKGLHKVAVKIIDKRNLKSKDADKLYREVNILKSVKHPNVVRIFDFFDEPERFLIVMEYIDGGELFDKIVDEESSFTEEESRGVVRTLALALQHCNQNGVVHRDIKPENVLLTSDGQIKLADFGLSKQVDAEMMDFSLLQTMCGTPNYVAPEVLSGKPYDYKCDVWSLGVIAFLLLSGGYLPFFINPKREGKDDLLNKVKAARWKFSPEKAWVGVSDQGKDFIKCTLQKDPNQRLTYEQLLGHPWFKNEKKEMTKRLINVGGMLRFNRRRKILTAAKVHEAVDAMKEMMGPPGEEEEPTNMNTAWESVKDLPVVMELDPSGDLFDDEGYEYDEGFDD